MVIVLAGALALVLRNRSAALRHLVWCTAFAGLLVLPLLSFSLPALQLRIPSSFLDSALVFRTSAPALNEPNGAIADAQKITYPVHHANPWPPDWRTALVLLWIAGTAVSLAQMLIGLMAIQRLKRRSNSLTLSELPVLAKLLALDQEVSVREAPAGSMPITFGLFRTTVFLPADVREYSPDRRRMVLLHELAHARRGDTVTHLMARTALALYWWSPFAWFAWREFLKERERAADDLVLRAGVCASAYASQLLEVATSLQSPPAVAYACVPMARRSQLEGRLLSILDPRRSRSAPRVSPGMLLLLAIVCIAPIAAMRAQSASVQPSAATPTTNDAFTAFINSGDLARERGQFGDAKTSYTQALNNAHSGSDTATALIRLGTVELASKHLSQAVDDFDQAGKADTQHAGEADMWMAIAQQAQNNLPAAEALYHSAFAATPPDSATAATILELYSHLLEQEDKSDQASTIQTQAAAIRRAEGNKARLASGPPEPDVYAIGGPVKAPSTISKIEPQYTPEARIAKYGGTVLLSLQIAADGSTRNIKVISGGPFGLAEKAVEAVRQWKFSPATRNGQPVAVVANIEVNFRLM
jgi:TonB family protein